MYALLSRPQAAIMGIINTTPDSFSDGGRYIAPDEALKHALQLVQEGADILDVGGESTRPGAEEVSLQQELDRVLPVIERITKETDTPVSIDTYKPQVMVEAVKAGASLINDVNGLRADGALDAVVSAGVPVCVMHMLGQPKNMQKQPEYDDVVNDVIAFLIERIEACVYSGIPRDSIIVDPGIGFGKSLTHNLQLLNAIELMREQLQCELLIGVSRKSMIDALLNRAVEQRLPSSLGLAVQARLNGAKIIRVHDVQATYDAIRSVEAVLNV